MPNLWQFDLPTGVRLIKIIGTLNHKLYAYTHNDVTITIWELTEFVRNSWRQRWKFDFAEASYMTATTMPEDNAFYILFTGRYLEAPEAYHLDILRVNVDSDDKNFIRYTSSDAQSVFDLAEIYGLHQETDVMVAGVSDLFVYDRGLVAGEIPLTRFRLDHVNRTFSGSREPIKADNRQGRSAIYATLIDADRRRIVKLTIENKLRIYDDENRAWREYEQATDGSGGDIMLADAYLRHIGIGQSYNYDYTRLAMVSSPITLLGGGNVLLLVYRRDGRVLFYRVALDDDAAIFRLRRVARLRHRIAQGYISCDRRAITILSSPGYTIPLEPLTLRASAFKTAQRKHGHFDDRDDTTIRRLCNIKHHEPLL